MITPTYFAFHVAHVIRPTTTINAPFRPRLDRPGVALLEVRARLLARVRIYMIEQKRLKLYVLFHAYPHGYVDDAPMHALVAGRLGDGSVVAPEVYRIVHVHRLERVPSIELGVPAMEDEAS